jgi:cell wall-associated NlpC family hydrolase
MNNALKFALAAAVGFTATVAVTPDAHAATTIRAKALSTAASQKGARYVYGAEGGYDKGYDCSGLVYYSYRKNGRTLPRTAQSQYNKSAHVSPSSRQKGDLVFIGRSSDSIYHVGIYAGFWDGKGWMWNANTGSYRGRKVVLAPIREYTAGSPRAYYGRISG